MEVNLKMINRVIFLEKKAAYNNFKYLERIKYQVFDISKLENDLRFFNSTGYLRGKFNK